MLFINDTLWSTHKDKTVSKDERGKPVSTIPDGFAAAQVCLTEPGGLEPNPNDNTRWFHAVIDSGYSGNLLLNDRQLVFGAKRPIKHFSELSSIASLSDVKGINLKYPLFGGTLWIRSTEIGIRPLEIPLLRSTDGGFHYAGSNSQPFPLIGCRALDSACLQLTFDFRSSKYFIYRHFDRFGKRLMKRGFINREQLIIALCQQASLRGKLEEFQWRSEYVELFAYLLQSFCHPNDVCKSLGAIALDDYFITEEKFRALHLSINRDEKRIGEMLVKLGFLTEDDLKKELETYKTVHQL